MIRRKCKMMSEVIFITAVGSISILTQGKPPVMMDEAAQNVLVADNGASFAIALNEASGLDAEKSVPVLLAVAAGEENQDEKKPDSALSLVAAMLAFSPQPIMQGAGQPAQAQNVAAIQSGIGQTGLYEGNGQQMAAVYAQANVQAKENDLERAGELSGIMAEAQNMPADEEQATVYQNTEKPFTGMNKVQVAQKENEASNINAFTVQNLNGQENSENREGADGFQNPAMALQTHHSVQGRKEKREDETPFTLPVTATVIAQRSEHVQQAQNTQATQEAVTDPTAREEHAALQVARATVSAIKRGAAEYKLRLRPEGLGQVEVTVSTKGSEISLSMITDNEGAKGLILGHADELRAELRAQNYQINDLTVEVSMDNSGGGEFTSSRQSQSTFEQGRAVMEESHFNQAEVQPPSSGMQRPAPRSSTISYRV